MLEPTKADRRRTMEERQQPPSAMRGRRPLAARDFVQARIYASEAEVIHDALRHLLRARPDARIRLAVHRYQSEEISLARAAELAGVSWDQMREILLEAGIQPRLGPQTVEEAEAEAQALRDYFAARQ
jgi:predicted HTH domain antitoxin